ncbi:MAG: J domain-containing protein [Bacteroidota bacterium]
MKNYYAVLGIQSSASEAEIKKAYRDGCKKYHPDLNAHPDAHLMFIEIHEAYEFLCDETNRRLYHRSISSDHKRQGNQQKYQNWQQQKSREAQKRATYYAQQDFESFKKSKYYKLASNINLGYNLLFLGLCLMIIVVPLYMYVEQQTYPLDRQKPFLIFLVPMIMGFALGLYAFNSWFIEKRDIFK